MTTTTPIGLPVTPEDLVDLERYPLGDLDGTAMAPVLDRARSEVAPRIRSADDERHDDVARVLAGDRAEVVRLEMTPGTLLVFEGRNSLHRVSPISGPVDRMVGLVAARDHPENPYFSGV
jgi:hypothetical protein